MEYNFSKLTDKKDSSSLNEDVQPNLKKLHEFEDIINIELTYQKSTEEILEQYYIQNEGYLNGDFLLSDEEISIIEALINICEEIRM